VALNAISAMRDIGAREISATIGALDMRPLLRSFRGVVCSGNGSSPGSGSENALWNAFLRTYQRRSRKSYLQKASQSALKTSCTAEDSNLFSYRRDGVTGRQAGIVWL